MLAATIGSDEILVEPPRNLKKGDNNLWEPTADGLS
jgi:hypothetical protein